MAECKNVKKIKEFAADGIAPTLGSEYINKLTDEEYKIWVKYHLTNCEREEIMGYSSHVVYVAEKI